MIEADGILLGSPVYFADLSCRNESPDRPRGFRGQGHGDMFKRRSGAAVVAVPGGGHSLPSIPSTTFSSINQMSVPGSNYWNIGVGREKGEVKTMPKASNHETPGQNHGLVDEEEMNGKISG